jgi:hypothetical protein
MNDYLEVETELSAGRKILTIEPEDGSYNLIESGSIVGVIKKKDDQWSFTKGSYSEDDAVILGKLIEQSHIFPIKSTDP